MKKINERFNRKDISGESDIYRKYSKQFDSLFNIKEVIKSKKEFESIYVENLEFEKEIKRFKSSITFCVGYTGIGKTTSIRHCFGLEISNDIRINPIENELVFPTFFDSYWLNKENGFDLPGRIATMCTKLEEEYPYLRELLKTDCGKEEFYNFMRKYAASPALECINPVEAMDMDKSQLIRMKLNGAYKKNPFEFLASQLKYYISKNYDKYKRLIIILDDIEMLPENNQKEIIGDFIMLQKFMQKTDYPDNNDYQVNLLISIQPHMYHMLITSRYLEISGVSEPAILKRTVDFNSIFKKRFDYYTKFNQYDGNKEDINYNNLMMIINNLDKEYENIILHLCLFNIRKGLAFYSMIFANRFWVQYNKAKEEDYMIEPSEYKFDNICVIRALACNENHVFWEEDNSIIPNVFYTTEDEDLSIYCLLVLQYFYRKNENKEYGINAMEFSNIKEEWESIFKETKIEIIDKFIKSLEFLYEKKILRKLIKNFSDTEFLNVKGLLKEKSKIYISSRGKELYDMLSRDSVYLEMLRENAWRNYENRRAYSELSSRELMDESNQILIFEDLLEYINYLREEEEDVLLIVKRARKNREYKKAFGKNLAVEALLKGVKRSLEFSGIMFDIWNDFVEVEKNINETKRQLT